MQKKTLARVRVKDATLGIIEAVFASHLVDRADLAKAAADVIDKDGDVTLKGAFTAGQPVVISAYGHGSWEGRLPVGKGVIREEGDLAIMEGQFFLNTSHGADTFEVVKQLSEDDLQEWSYSLHDVTSSRGNVAGKAVRILERIALVKEVSPVLMGAGVETRTLAAKGTKQLASSLRRLLYEAGSDRWKASYAWVVDYDVDEGYVVFEVETYLEGEGWSSRMLQVDFTRTDTAVVLGDTETEVHQTAVFLPKQAGLTFSEHIDAVVAAVDGLDARAQGVVALRAEKGKTLSAATRDQLAHLAERITAVKALADAPTHDNHLDELEREWLRSVAIAQGV